MEFRRRVVSFFLRIVLNTICKIDCREYIEALSKCEPLIVIFNHINFLEVPILVAHSYPQKVTGLVKSETWDNPFFAFLFNSYKAIPIDRRGAFSEAFKQVKEAIDNGYYMCISPEGTRSSNGVLGRGKAGVIQLAFDANVPILPVAHYGGENIWANLKSFKRTLMCFKAGKPFRIKFEGKPCREEREEIMIEVMRQMAKLLPEQMRGIYTGQEEQECKYLEFI
jgi:1-acyl-sn-glycerol-3-phosphate acyltransferase